MTSPTIKETGDLFLVTKAKRQSADLYAQAAKSVGWRALQDVCEKSPGYAPGLSKRVLE